MSAGSSCGGMARPEISAIVIDLSGEPLTWYLPSESSMSSGAASSIAAQMRLALSCTLRAAARAPRRPPQASASRRYPSPRRPGRCRRAGSSRLGSIPRMSPAICAKLVSIPGRAARSRRRSPSRWASPGRWPTRRTPPGGPRPAGPPPATGRGRRPRHRSRSRPRDRRPGALLLLGAERVHVEVRAACRACLVVARVVDDPERCLERELLLRDEVLAPQLEPVHAKLVGELSIVSSIQVASGRPAPRIASVHILFVKTPVIVMSIAGNRSSRPSREAERRDEGVRSADRPRGRR